jgi:Nodulation protein Z (NodZ)
MRYVVARHCYGGIGDHLSCLVGAWWLAKRTNRTLVVDWRGSRFNPDPSMESNCFFSYFSRRDEIGGVEIIADNRVGAFNYPLPVWPPKWTPVALASPNHLSHDFAEIAQANKIVTSEIDPPEPTIVLSQWLDPPPPREAVRIFLQCLTPVESIADTAQRFWDAHIGKVPAVAIHIRHGNGENLGSRSAYWLGPVALIKQWIINTRSDVHKRGISGRFSDNMPPSLIGEPDQIVYERRFCRRVAEAFYSLAIPNAVPILFSDAAHIVEIMREVLPTVVAKPKREVKRGEGPLHQINAASVRSDSDGVRSGTISDDITFDMFVELELMRRCSGLVFMDSGFSLLTRTSLDENRLIRLKPTLINRLISRIMGRLIKGLNLTFLAGLFSRPA